MSGIEIQVMFINVYIYIFKYSKIHTQKIHSHVLIVETHGCLKRFFRIGRFCVVGSLEVGEIKIEHPLRLGAASLGVLLCVICKAAFCMQIEGGARYFTEIKC